MFSSRVPNPIVVLALAFWATFFAFTAQRVMQSLDFWLYDVGFSSKSVTVPQDMVILGIDEKFMEGRHAYLAPRDRLATLIENAITGKPRAIALDVWLDSRIDTGPNGVDARLRKAFLKAKAAKVPIILSDIPDEFTVDAGEGQTAHGATIPFFKDAVANVGSVLTSPDEDGAIRWCQWEFTHQTPPLPLQMARLGGLKNFEIKGDKPIISVPLDYCGPAGTVPTQSASDFLENPFLAPLLEGKLVFIGATYPRSRDFQTTPYRGGKPMYGVEILAQATDSLRRGAPRHSNLTPAALLFDFALVFVASLAVTFCALRSTLTGVLSAVVFLGIAVLCALLSARDASAFWQFRFHPASAFFLALPLATSGGIAWRNLIQGRELKLVRDTFSAYMGDEILASLNGKMPELGGETRSIAVLFCDIRGYSALAESMSDDPRALLDELNAHFAPLVAALKKRGAYVDNYVGDLVMALFGAPFSAGSFESDTRAAVLAALDFVELVEARNQIRRESGLLPIEVGIGVHCGVAVVGNMGSQDSKQGGKIHYTAIGDVVNVASRVESATRGQNVALLVTKEVVETCGKSSDLPAWESLGEVAVKGRAAPVEIFKMAEREGVISDETI